ncbi:hypothetical protein NL676_000520 [Syzygium grande]|nr:hypothetical protein NL676_000520 [Syzygium grande]
MPLRQSRSQMSRRRQLRQPLVADLRQPHCESSQFNSIRHSLVACLILDSIEWSNTASPVKRSNDPPSSGSSNPSSEPHELSGDTTSSSRNPKKTSSHLRPVAVQGGRTGRREHGCPLRANVAGQDWAVGEGGAHWVVDRTADVHSTGSSSYIDPVLSSSSLSSSSPVVAAVEVEEEEALNPLAFLRSRDLASGGESHHHGGRRDAAAVAEEGGADAAWWWWGSAGATGASATIRPPPSVSSPTRPSPPSLPSAENAIYPPPPATGGANPKPLPPKLPHLLLLPNRKPEKTDHPTGPPQFSPGFYAFWVGSASSVFGIPETSKFKYGAQTVILSAFWVCCERERRRFGSGLGIRAEVTHAQPNSPPVFCSRTEMPMSSLAID